MKLTPTTEPTYLDVVAAARDAAIALPSHLAHLFLVLATRYPEIRPPAVLLASQTGTSARTVERNLSQLAQRGWIVSMPISRGVERGGVSYRFLLLPTLTRVGEPPLLVGRGPAGWEPERLRVGGSDFPSLMTVGDGPGRAGDLPSLMTVND